jgi:hypothetical protein
MSYREPAEVASPITVGEPVYVTHVRADLQRMLTAAGFEKVEQWGTFHQKVRRYATARIEVARGASFWDWLFCMGPYRAIREFEAEMRKIAASRECDAAVDGALEGIVPE